MLPQPTDPAQISGLVFRSYRKAIEELKIFDLVLTHLRPPTAQLLTKPPLPSQWFPAQHLADICVAAEKVGGKKATWFLGHHATVNGASPLLMPMIQLALKMSGVQPSALFSRLRMMSGNSMRGFSFSYETIDDRSGTIEVAISESFPATTFLAYEGTLAAAFTWCKTTGTVTPTAPLVDGPRASFLARWGKGVSSP